MDNKAVTCKVSTGISGSKAAPSGNLMALRRHSNAGMRALLWATSSAKSLGCSFGSELQTSQDNIFPNILTPDSIPQFTIPSLTVQAGDSRAPAESTRNRHREGEEGPDVDIWPTCPTPQWMSSDLCVPPPDRRAQRSVSDPLMKSSLKREVSYPGPYMEEVHQHCLDPASRAALSLPHLAKVTTPYGFVTLSQSPQMASEEALLCQTGLHRSLTKRDQGVALSRGTKTPVTRTGRTGSRGSSSHWPAACQRLSKDSADCQTEKALSGGDCHSVVTESSGGRGPREAGASGGRGLGGDARYFTQVAKRQEAKAAAV
ncbi:hypothetical protein NHX12_033902 [Muraenolepis orangiensis]|uniref:Uncharacterized protein n=1 Tax=Muraenolepis orangiensis TaxID=630683 RepID=A0A9Q0IJ85_9TELE|nr:hypothetical protein NHX12_033902 [Muraenolepis orangiensis]